MEDCIRVPATVSAGENRPVENKLSIPLYKGVRREFSFLGRPLVVSPGMDVFNFYRKVYNIEARKWSNALKAEYLRHVTNLDIFLRDFSVMYFHFRKPLIEASMDILLEAGIYDISKQTFEDQHTADFCLCAEDMQVMIDSFNKTIEANQQRKIGMYNMMPGIVFGGLGGLVAATAVNVAVHSIAEADIKNANVTQAQRKELFGRINPDALMERAFLDYWRIFLSMTFWMKKRGLDVWYVGDDDTQRAKSIFQNLCEGKIPEDKVPDAIITILQTQPYSDDYLKYLVHRYGETPEVKVICNYFSSDIL